LLTIDRLLTNELVLAVLPARLVWFGFWLVLVSAIEPLMLVLLIEWLEKLGTGKDSGRCRLYQQNQISLDW